MAGIYIHIPFCRQQCYYCDFYRTLNTNQIKKFITSLKREGINRKRYLNNEKVETIYFGGGTPSILSISELKDIFVFLYNHFPIVPKPEITFEANPDDLNINYLQQLHQLGINRLSIGIQSFQDAHLNKLNRRHSSGQAINSVNNAEKAGFTNISVDLIYGFAGLTLQQWKSALNIVFKLPVNHLSAYHLTYHKGTVFYSWIKEGIMKELPETESVGQFQLLTDLTAQGGFEQYEISNFAKNKMYSRHNTSYWKGKKYLGLGPSAHSYDGFSRRWNESDLENYIKCVENDCSFFHEEQLTLTDKYNEYVLTNMRTKWGVSSITIEQQFGKDKVDHFLKTTEKYLILKKMTMFNEVFYLTREGLFVSDDIIAEFMII